MKRRQEKTAERSGAATEKVDSYATASSREREAKGRKRRKQAGTLVSAQQPEGQETTAACATISWQIRQ